ncbi:MAG: 50S ribosomal protein L11 methyltransferase [Bacteroidota bacterium]
MKSRKWCQISVRIDEPYQDLLVGQLALLGFTGFVQEEKSLNCFISINKWTSSIRAKFQKTLERFKFEFPVVDLSFTVKSIREENWNKTWEKQTGIVEATPRIIIKPSWKKLPKHYRNKIVLHVDPKMSFGTGHHETTRLSLSLLERFLQPKMKVIDFGCGTGVLGIACVKLGAKSVVAVDNDPWAIENTRENIKRNNVQRRMTVRLGNVSAIPRSKYDLIVANIDFPTISRFIKSIVDRIRKDGIFILSGILTSDMPALLSLFEKNLLVPVKLDNENEWTAVALRRVL